MDNLSRQQRPKRLGEILIQQGVIKEWDIEQALDHQKQKGGRLGSILVNLKFCTDEQIRLALKQQMGVEVLDLQSFEPSDDVLHIIPLEMIRKYEVIPLKQDSGKLFVAMMDPYNLGAIDDIRFYTGVSRLVISTCTEIDFKKFITKHLETKSLIDEIMQEDEFYKKAIKFLSADDDEEVIEKEPEADAVETKFAHQLEIAASQSPIVTLCNFILYESVNRRASDIHIEPYETFFRVRIRVDGRLQTLLNPPRRLHPTIIARFKVISELDISNRRTPQDGHLSVEYQNETIHFRVSTLPTIYGEKCVIRLLKKDFSLHDINKIGFEERELGLVKKSLNAPQGIILVTGPTGSGKTTTLHAGLNYINNSEVNIVTLEDPVEASISGINHVAIHNKGGVTFASGLRSILRQDPDVVFIGEMRDPEVSNIAFRAALTGHLVLSTLHTNSAIESIIRLSDMGVPSYLVASALLMIIAQRLVRKVCNGCAMKHVPTDEEIAQFELTENQLKDSNIRKGKGCSVCAETGYLGRVAVYEILNVDYEMREMIRENAQTGQIYEYALKKGLKPLFQSGIYRVLTGETTFSEVNRVLFKIS